MKILARDGQFMHRLVQDWIQVEPGHSVLDIGCGPGSYFTHLPDGARFVGVDPNPDYIKTATEKHGTRAQFHCAGIDNFPQFEVATFDRVLAMGVLHHLSNSQVERLFEIASTLLKPRGALITVDPCFTANQDPIERFIVSRDRGKWVRTTRVYEDFSRKHFPNVVSSEFHNQLRIPFAHWVMKCTKTENR